MSDQIRSVLTGKEWLYRPNGGNLGDALIAYAERHFFNNSDFNVKRLTSKNYSEIGQSSNFIYGGGGGLLDHYINRLSFMREIVKDLFRPNLKNIVILPSTFYESDALVKRFDDRFTVFCRDKRSYDYCRSLNNKARFMLDDDMAIRHTDYSDLSNVKVTEYNLLQRCRKADDYVKLNKTDTAYFIRNDGEKTITGRYKHEFDLSSIMNIIGLNITDQYIDSASSILYNTIDKYKTIYTNRLHIGILATKMGKTVKLLDNSYGKNKAIFDHSLCKYDNCQFLV